MPDLIASPALRHAPVTRGATTLALVDPGPITAVALLPGQGKAAAKALKPLGFTMPVPNRSLSAGGVRLVWAGRDLAFLIGAPAPDLGAIPAFAQTDGWACLTLEGPLAADALMRLVPLDLRRMAEGEAARAPLNHMQMVLWRTPAGFALLVFRSMARSAWHEIDEALAMVEARAALAAKG